MNRRTITIALCNNEQQHKRLQELVNFKAEVENWQDRSVISIVDNRHVDIRYVPAWILIDEIKNTENEFINSVHEYVDKVNFHFNYFNAMAMAYMFLMCGKSFSTYNGKRMCVYNPTTENQYDNGELKIFYELVDAFYQEDLKTGDTNIVKIEKEYFDEIFEKAKEVEC